MFFPVKRITYRKWIVPFGTFSTSKSLVKPSIVMIPFCWTWSHPGNGRQKTSKSPQKQLNSLNAGWFCVWSGLHCYRFPLLKQLQEAPNTFSPWQNSTQFSPTCALRNMLHMNVLQHVKLWQSLVLGANLTWFNCDDDAWSVKVLRKQWWKTKILAKIRVGFSPFLASKQIRTCNKQKEDSTACSMPKPGDSFSFFTVLRCFFVSSRLVEREQFLRPRDPSNSWTAFSTWIVNGSVWRSSAYGAVLNFLGKPSAKDRAWLLFLPLLWRGGGLESEFLLLLHRVLVVWDAQLEASGHWLNEVWLVESSVIQIRRWHNKLLPKTSDSWSSSLIVHLNLPDLLGWMMRLFYHDPWHKMVWVYSREVQRCWGDVSFLASMFICLNKFGWRNILCRIRT